VTGIEVLEAAAPEDLRVLSAGIQAFNAAANPAARGRLTVLLRDATGFVVGGCHGELVGTEFFVVWLWVAEEHRGEGEGARLLERAEREAATRGALRATVDTYAFQAPGFYRRAGYTELSRIDDYSLGHARIWFRKELL
jgi:GNAT superfamily N-acetyltransferase